MDTLPQRHGLHVELPPPAPDSLSQGQALPSIASLTAGVPTEQPLRPRQHSEARDPRDVRDSGNWSISQNSSGVSNNMGLQIHHILNNPNDSPQRNSIPETPSSVRHPSYASSALPSLNQGFDNRYSIDASSTQDSRRSSIDSRVHGQMSSLALGGPTSPYELSQNPSRTSLVSNLQRERGITNPDQRPNGTSPLSPMGSRPSWSSQRPTHQPRRAPVINPNPRSVSGAPDPMAASPTKGFAWAFPGHDGLENEHPGERRGSSSGRSSTERTMSRQNSYATSINSSIYTTDSNLPNGQRRFIKEEDPATTHHHSLQHRTLTNLQSADQANTPGGGNYSRTPELRAMHKLAERKRRSEMKDLFDSLNSILPNSPGSKSSKWEVLSKACDYIKACKNQLEALRQENTRLRQYADHSRRLEEENNMLRQEMTTVWEHLRRADPSNPHVHGSYTNELAQSQQVPQMQAQGSKYNLPPIQHQQPPPPPPPQQHPQAPPQWGPPPATSAMQGIEFSGMRPYEHSHRQ